VVLAQEAGVLVVGRVDDPAVLRRQVAVQLVVEDRDVNLAEKLVN